MRGRLDHLCSIARRQLALRAGGGTLSTTGVVHEAYLKLANHSGVAWRDRAHFLALASVAMRQVLIDRAKARLTRKRGWGPARVTLDNELIASDDQPTVVLDINDALDRLALVEPRLAQVVECPSSAG